ncbi:MAG: c-type cytochrome [Thermodesulfobacteriota bacterium]
MKKIRLLLLLLVLGVAVAAGCAEKKKPAKEVKKEEAAATAPAVKEAVAAKPADEVKVVKQEEATAPAVKAMEAPGAVESVKGVAEGAAIFKAKCAACHGPEGRGTAMAPAFTGNEWVRGAERGEIAGVIKNGRQGPAKRYKRFALGMPANALDEGDINALVAYLKSLAAE